MAAPSPGEGRAVMDRIAGFEHIPFDYRGRPVPKRLHPPEKTPELFERHLARTRSRSTSRITRPTSSPRVLREPRRPIRRARTAHAFGWYSGSSNAWSNPGRFAGAVGASLASSVALGLDRALASSSGAGEAADRRAAAVAEGVAAGSCRAACEGPSHRHGGTARHEPSNIPRL